MACHAPRDEYIAGAVVALETDDQASMACFCGTESEVWRTFRVGDAKIYKKIDPLSFGQRQEWLTLQILSHLLYHLLSGVRDHVDC